MGELTFEDYLIYNLNGVVQYAFPNAHGVRVTQSPSDSESYSIELLKYEGGLWHNVEASEVPEATGLVTAGGWGDVSNMLYAIRAIEALHMEPEPPHDPSGAEVIPAEFLSEEHSIEVIPAESEAQ